MTHRVSVLFVCLGNICRSPTAHGVLRAKVDAAGLSSHVVVDSAGTGNWHVGATPDRRARATARAHGVSIDDLSARQVTAADLADYDYVIAMDGENHADLCVMATVNGVAGDRVSLFTHWCPDDEESEEGVPDPYAGGDAGFEHVFSMIDAGTDTMMERIRADLAPR
ncbi:low molecular weight protein-tyrosine-phosphatase [Salinisphaera orenii]|uniref:low molecular weight protein-tyrosine-phosphatase n=1 Tax=Salinisphaera orenii TaxID=856731 RepID=UPI000DBE1EB1